MVVKIIPNDKGNPPGKLADAELHFTDGALEGLKLIGFSIWERRGSGGGRNVTFPARQYVVNGDRRSFALLRPIVAVLVVFSTIWDFKIFDQIYVMAAGVPDRAADTAAVAAYREGFALSHYGLGSAVAVVLFLILLAFSLLYVRLIGREGTA